MGDIDTIWFVAREDEAAALIERGESAGFNPFTKEATTVSVARFDASAAAKLPSIREEWLLGHAVADLLGCVGLRPTLVNSNEDELWRIPDDRVAAFAALPESNLASLHAAWSKRVKDVKHDLAVVQKLHRLAKRVTTDSSLYGFVEASGR